MKNSSKNTIVLLILLILLGTLSFLYMACEPPLPLKVENRTDMVLTVYVEKQKIGDVKPNNSIKVKNLAMTKTYYLIEAKNSKGESGFSKKFSWYELRDADWRVVIPTSFE
jgi:hypothetical protein